MARGGICLFLAWLAVLAGGCSDGKKAGVDAGPPADAATVVSPPFATLMDLSGSVEFRTDPGVWQKAVQNQALSKQDSVRTGPGSAVTVAFSDGRKLVLAADSEITLSEAEGVFSLMVGRGKVEVVGQSRAAFRLVFGASNDFMTIEEGQAQVELTPDGQVRIQMLIGHAVIQRGDERTPLDAGNKFAFEFGAVRVVDVETKLRDRRLRSEIRTPETKRFARVRKAEQIIRAGTEVRLQNTVAEILDNEGGQVTLGARSRATFEGTTRSALGDREGTLNLQTGEARVRLRRGQKGGTTEVVSTPHATIAASARGLTAETDVKTGPAGTEVVVKTGKVDVKVGDRSVSMEPGQQLRVAKGGEVSGPTRTPQPGIWAREAALTRLYYDRPLGRIGFRWKVGDAANPMVLEVAASKAFERHLLREPLNDNMFIFEGLPPGRYFWRVVPASGADPANPVRVGRLELVRDPTASGKGVGKLDNLVRDTGIQTKIYFQGKVPSLTFSWDDVEGAKDYFVRIFSEDNLEKPLIAQASPTKRLGLSAGQLKEGTYYWYQAARDESGKEFRASQMNKLLLAFENASPLLRIDSPRSLDKVADGQVEIRGQAAIGSTLLVNQKPIQIAADGRFQQTLEGVARNSILVFQLKKPTGGEVFFVRHLR